MRLSSNYLYVSKLAKDRLGEFERMDLYFDKESKVLKIQPNEKGLLLMRKNGQVSVAGLDMPKGRYFWWGEDIYKYQVST